MISLSLEIKVDEVLLLSFPPYVSSNKRHESRGYFKSTVRQVISRVEAYDRRDSVWKGYTRDAVADRSEEHPHNHFLEHPKPKMGSDRERREKENGQVP